MQKKGDFLMYKITERGNDKREPGLWVAGATRGWVTIAEGPEPNDQQYRSNHIQQRCSKERGKEGKIARRLANQELSMARSNKDNWAKQLQEGTYRMGRA